MAWISVLLTLLVASVATQAAVLQHERRDDYEYEEPSIVEAEEVGHPDDFLSKLMAVNEAVDNVVTEELTGFEENLEVFGKELTNVMMSFQVKFTKAMVPMLEACPADVLKDAVVNILKAVLGMIDDLKSVVEEYNPLHPQHAEQLRALIRRKLTNISTLGGAIGKLFDAVDDLVVTAVEAYVNKMATSAAQGKVVIAELEKIPAEFLKQIIIQGMNEPAKIGGGY